MMWRELKRVPLDFAWPIEEPWTGYVNPFDEQCVNCPDCDGDGCSLCSGNGWRWTSDEAREASKAWKPTDPPTGDGYQLWETVVGSPLTPVFATLDELCEHAAEHCTPFAEFKATAEQWRVILTRNCKMAINFDDRTVEVA